MNILKTEKWIALTLLIVMVIQWIPVDAMGSQWPVEELNVYENTFDDISDITDFAAYYGKNAKEGLAATPAAEDWTVDGVLSRLAKPHGIGGFW